ncbi:MAG TPA: hypothetical protein VMA83_12270 [Solirubrobacteraceae bacterium]|nr:hypothetical protein [Solirubrobacteraceae bacterium]
MGDTAAHAELQELRLADDPERWRALGFSTSGDSLRIGAVDVRLQGRHDGRAITGWTLAGPLSGELDGLPTELAPERHPAAGAQHANGVTHIDHIVAVSPDLDRTVTALEDAGLDLRRVREEPTPAGAPRQAFFRLGEVILEVVAEPEAVAQAHGGRDRDAFFWGLALSVPDIALAAPFFGDALGEPHAAVQPGRKIATVKRSAGLCAPVALITPREET